MLWHSRMLCSTGSRAALPLLCHALLRAAPGRALVRHHAVLPLAHPRTRLRASATGAVDRGLLHRYRRVRHASARHTPARQGRRSSSDLLSSLGQLPPVVTLMVTHLYPLDSGKSTPVAPARPGHRSRPSNSPSRSIPTQFLATVTCYH